MVIKNWEDWVLRPALAMDRYPVKKREKDDKFHVKRELVFPLSKFKDRLL